MYKRLHLNEEEHNKFIEEHPNGDLLQLTDWAESKKLTGWYYRRFALADETSELKGVATLLFKKVPRINTTLCYISRDRKSTRLNSSHVAISYAGFCLKT